MPEELKVSVEETPPRTPPTPSLDERIKKQKEAVRVLTQKAQIEEKRIRQELERSILAALKAEEEALNRLFEEKRQERRALAEKLLDHGLVDYLAPAHHPDCGPMGPHCTRCMLQEHVSYCDYDFFAGLTVHVERGEDD